MVGCVRPGWGGGYSGYTPGFRGSKTSFINGSGLKLGSDLNKPSALRAPSASPQQITCKVGGGGGETELAPKPIVARALFPSAETRGAAAKGQS